MSDLADLFPGFGAEWINTSAGRIFARTGGKGPPLLLLHGFSETHVMWHRVAPELAEHFTLIVADLPGYGWSDMPRSDDAHTPYTKRAMAKVLIEAMEQLGFRVTHIYGMTELQGPSTYCAPQDAWSALPLAERAGFSARQGVRYPVVDGQMVADTKTMTPVPRDGQSIGEIMVRGNTVMLGYLKDPKATAEAFRGGWMHTGDLAVEHPDGYVEIKDRAKDIIISGGENISSVEVEIALYKHPAVQLAAVVARPDSKWGETPCAFVQLKPGTQATEDEMIAFCRDRLAHFKAPKSVVFGPLPTTATGKVQKFTLRERARGL